MKIMDRFIFFFQIFFFFSFMDLFFTLPTSLQNMKDSLIYDITQEIPKKRFFQKRGSWMINVELIANLMELQFYITMDLIKVSKIWNP